MKLLLAWSSSLFLAIAIGLTGLGVRSFVMETVPDAPSPGRSEGGRSGIVAAISPATIDVNLGEMQPQSPIHYRVKLTNTGSVPAKIVGIPGLCNLLGCVDTVDPPATIPPHQQATIDFRLTCRGKPADPFRIVTAIYLDIDDRSGLAIPVHFTGTVSRAGGSP